MRYGVNYVPARNWWHSWIDWDPDTLAVDLAAIRGLGMDHVRIQLVWPVFQPDPSWVSPVMLERLAAFMGLADSSGLDVCVSVLDGWLSGMYLRPFWHGEDRSMFADPQLIRAQELLLREVAVAIGGHRRLLGIDIGNEPNVLTRFAGNTRSTAADAGAWTRRMLGHVEALLPGRMHVIGFDHVPWLGDSLFSREDVVSSADTIAIHAWTAFTGALERYGAFGTGSLHLGEYMIELVRAFRHDAARSCGTRGSQRPPTEDGRALEHRAPERPWIWLQEYGASGEWMPEERIADHAEAFTRAVLDAPDLWGVTWWCSHDIDRRFSAFAELEHDLGLLTVDNEVKPVGARLRDLIAEAGSEVEPRPRSTVLPLPRNRVPDLDFADRFFALIDAGERPAIVRER